LLTALNREINEELGVKHFFNLLPQAFLLTICLISDAKQCKEHFDIWFLLETNGLDFKVNPTEFYDTGWFTIAEAKNIIVDLYNLQAMEIVENKSS